MKVTLKGKIIATNIYIKKETHRTHLPPHSTAQEEEDSQRLAESHRMRVGRDAQRLASCCMSQVCHRQTETFTPYGTERGRC